MALALRRSPHDREIARLAVPALGALAIEPLYVLVDTAIVGRLGTHPLAGVAVAGSVLTAAFALCNFLAYATTAAVARRVGAGDEHGAAAQGVDALWLASGLGAALAIVGLAASGPLVGLMGASTAVRPFALTYLRISTAGLPGVLLMLAGVGFLRGRQDTRTPLVVALVANVANLVLEVVFVYVLDLGVAGSAWSTVIVQLASAAVVVAIVLGSAREVGAPRRPHPAGIRRAAAVGAHLVVRTGSLIASFLVTTAVAARIGDAEVAAHQVVFQLFLLLALSLDALAIAAQALMGRYLGAGDPGAARRVSARMMEIGIGSGVVLALGVIAARPLLMIAFTGDAPVRALIGDTLWLLALLQPLNAAVFVLDGVLIGAGETAYLALAMLGAFGLFLPAALVVLVTGSGLVALWLVLGWLMVARLVPLLVRWRNDAWLVTGAVR